MATISKMATIRYMFWRLYSHHVREISNCTRTLWLRSFCVFLALDHHLYSCWIPVHLRVMLSLGTKHPHLAEEFKNGNFVVHKSSRAFSRIPIGQTREQNNKCVKGDGGTIGLTENTSELHWWLVTGPEISRIIAEFEAAMEEDNAKAPDLHHHEPVESIQITFEKQVLDLVTVVETMGYPFDEDSLDLLVLETRDIVDQQWQKPYVKYNRSERTTLQVWWMIELARDTSRYSSRYVLTNCRSSTVCQNGSYPMTSSRLTHSRRVVLSSLSYTFPAKFVVAI